MKNYSNHGIVGVVADGAAGCAVLSNSIAKEGESVILSYYAKCWLFFADGAVVCAV